MRPQHLKDMTSPITGIAGQRLIASLTAFANLCMEGRVPSVVRQILYGASLCALNKKDGGFRPIAVAVAKLTPALLGFGIQLGAEAATHAARSFLNNLTEGQGKLC